MVLKINIIKNNSIGKFLILFNQDNVVIGKFTINLYINHAINIKVKDFKLFFNDKFLFNFNNMKYFYSSSNNFIK